MPFLTTARLALTPLAPIHIGSGEDFEPTHYVIDDGLLHAFDPSRAALPEPLARRLGQLGEQADLLGIQRFFYENRAHFMPHARLLVPVAPGLAADYAAKIGQVANREAGGTDVINKLSIERATHSHDRPYIPASSLNFFRLVRDIMRVKTEHIRHAECRAIDRKKPDFIARLKFLIISV